MYPCSLAKGITFRGGGGITPRFGAWKRSDGTQIMCWLYWQHVLQFTGNGVVFNSYPAHCTVFIHIDNQVGGKFTVGGQSYQGIFQKCLGSSTNIDVGIQYLSLT